MYDSSVHVDCTDIIVVRLYLTFKQNWQELGSAVCFSPETRGTMAVSCTLIKLWFVTFKI